MVLFNSKWNVWMISLSPHTKFVPQSPLAKLKAIEISAQTQIANKKQFADEMKWQMQVNAIKREGKKTWKDTYTHVCIYQKRIFVFWLDQYLILILSARLSFT